MPVELISAPYTTRVQGDIWPIGVLVLDADGDLVDVAPVITITDPAGAATEATVTRKAAGVFWAEFATALTGRHVAEAVTAEYGRADAAAMVVVPTYAEQFPTVDDVDAYLKSGGGDHDWSTGEMASALLAETAAQARVCRMGAVYPDDLREALLRRVQRNLAMRPLALAMTRGDAEGGDTQVLPQNDPEVRRLERPHRKMPIG